MLIIALQLKSYLHKYTFLHTMHAQLKPVSEYFYLNIKQLDALNVIMSLFHASTCFEHMRSSSGGQNCTIQPLVSSH